MSVATGIGPAELVELDGEMFDALVDAVDRRWTPELELAAVQVETSSAMLVAYLRAHLRKGARLNLQPIAVPRPAWVLEAVDELEAPVGRPPVVGVAELASLAGKPIEPVEAAASG